MHETAWLPAATTILPPVSSLRMKLGRTCGRPCSEPWRNRLRRLRAKRCGDGSGRIPRVRRPSATTVELTERERRLEAVDQSGRARNRFRTRSPNVVGLSWPGVEQEFTNWRFVARSGSAEALPALVAAELRILHDLPE